MAVKKQQIIKEVANIDLKEENCSLEERLRVRRLQLLSVLKEISDKISVLKQKFKSCLDQMEGHELKGFSL